MKTALTLLLTCFLGCSTQSKTARDVELAKEGTWKVEYTIDGATKEIILLGEKPRTYGTGGGIGVANNTTVVWHGGQRVLTLPISAIVVITEAETKSGFKTPH